MLMKIPYIFSLYFLSVSRQPNKNNTKKEKAEGKENYEPPMVPHGMVEFKDEENRECEKRGMGKKRLQRLGHRPPGHHSPLNQHFQKVFVRRN